MSKSVKRPGSGRTKGSFSFVKVPLSTLVAKFADQSTPIVISRKYAETIGLKGLTAAPANNTLDSIEGATPETAVQA